jgi:hypothetical protein
MWKMKLQVVVIIKVVWLIMQRRSLDRDNGQNLRKGQGLLGAVEAIEVAKCDFIELSRFAEGLQKRLVEDVRRSGCEGRKI